MIFIILPRAERYCARVKEKRIDKYFNKYVNKQNLEYSLSCAGKDRIKKEIEYIIIKNRIHEKEWKNEIDSQIKKYLKNGIL